MPPLTASRARAARAASCCPRARRRSTRQSRPIARRNRAPLPGCRCIPRACRARGGARRTGAPPLLRFRRAASCTLPGAPHACTGARRHKQRSPGKGTCGGMREQIMCRGAHIFLDSSRGYVRRHVFSSDARRRWHAPKEHWSKPPASIRQVHGIGVLELPPGEARGDVEALARLALRKRQAHGFDAAGCDDLHEQVQAVAPVRLSGRWLARWSASQNVKTP
eukprot:scaffold1145_cov66-Phaeocystis_antarctica.AAC.3